MALARRQSYGGPESTFLLYRLSPGLSRFGSPIRGCCCSSFPREGGPIHFCWHRYWNQAAEGMFASVTPCAFIFVDYPNDAVDACTILNAPQEHILRTGLYLPESI